MGYTVFYFFAKTAAAKRLVLYSRSPVSTPDQTVLVEFQNKAKFQVKED